MTFEERVAADPRYRRLVRDRQRFAWALAAITMAVYVTFISLIAFDKPLLAVPIGHGATTLAVISGLAMLVAPVVICAIYVRRANRDFDRRLADLLADAA